MSMSDKYSGPAAYTRGLITSVPGVIAGSAGRSYRDCLHHRYIFHQLVLPAERSEECRTALCGGLYLPGCGVIMPDEFEGV